ncbi:uncharacterized protein LOC133478575 isoform X2 [Phyllopteryx taeniolatus]|uniref:uncharacterized protein LOC133478575 isoform X2 n=1 Tax=Phyllopteryx taeniolatus TaxID=161469 RepID=UPI002AD439D8|nr:uncharacterized protein LOC133478575 isoform X2 [Phyllopteryx taeniolatus]
MPASGRKGKKMQEEEEEEVGDAGVAPKGGDACNGNLYDWKDGHQEAMADFWRDHPEFYDKSSARYKDMQHKRAAVQSFLVDTQKTFEELNKPLPTYAQFVGHLRNMRTRFNRYTTKKSWQPAHKISAKEAFIIDRYQFLHRHIVGNRHLSHETHSFGRGHHLGEEDDDHDAVSFGSSVESSWQPGPSPRTFGRPRQKKTWEESNAIDRFGGDDDDDDAVSVGSSTESSSEPGPSPRAFGRWRRKKMRGESNAIERAELLDRARHHAGNMNRPLSNHKKRVKEFVRFLETEILQVPEHQFNNCSMEFIYLVRSFQAHGSVEANRATRSSANPSVGMSDQGMSGPIRSRGTCNQVQTTSRGTRRVPCGPQVNQQVGSYLKVENDWDSSDMKECERESINGRDAKDLEKQDIPRSWP